MISDMRDRGGAQRVVANLANAWASRGDRVRLITIAGSRQGGFALHPAVEAMPLGEMADSRSVFSSVGNNVARVVALRRAIRGSGASVVVSFVGTTNVLSVLACAGLGLRLVIAERNDPARQSLGRPWDWLRRLTYRYANLVTANSAGALQTLRSFVPSERLAEVPNPLVLPETVEAVPRSAPTLLSVGRLAAQKGYDLLLEAFAASEAARDGWRLAILGEGDLAGALAEQAERLGIASQVEWRGRSDSPFDHYAGADIFVLASRFEGTPNAVLEAMASGLPVIVTEGCGGAVELVACEGGGLVVPRENVPALTAAIDRLAGDEAFRRGLAGKAKEGVKSFDLESCLRRWDELLFGLDGTERDGASGVRPMNETGRDPTDLVRSL